MARPSYVYLKLKMPGPKGVITVTGNWQKVEECFQRVPKFPMHKWQQSKCKNTGRMQIRVICCAPRSLPLILHFSRPVKQSRFIFTRRTLMLLLLIYQQHSTANRKKRSSSSSVRTGTSLHGNLLTCRVYPGDWLSIVCESTRK